MNLAELNVVIGAEIDDFEKEIKTLEKGIGRLGDKLQATGESLTKFVTVPLSLLAGASLKAAGDMQALEKGFNAVYKGAGSAADELARVKEIAKLPGLGLKEAIQGSINLQAAGFSAEQARSALTGFGNALATVGKGKADLDGVSAALSQMAAKGKISAEEINQISERVPQIRKVMEKAFGTADTEALSKMGIGVDEFVSKVTTELNKLPKVTGGINNAFENMADTGISALSKMGDGLNKAFDVEGKMNAVADAATGLVEAFEALSPSTQKAIFVVAGLAAAAGPVLLAVGGLVSAVPLLVAGFAALTGPIGLVVVGVVAIGAALASFIASSKDATQEYNQQKESVQKLEQSMNPLLARYEELKGKTNLTKTEQTELRDIIEKVGHTIPGAISGFDKYGKAMGLNTEVAKEFIKQQQRIAEVKNKEVLREYRKEYNRLTEELKQTNSELQKRQDFLKTISDQQRGDRANLGIDDSGDLLRLSDTLAKLREARKGVGGYIDDLKGIKHASTEAGDAIEQVFTRTPKAGKIKLKKFEGPKAEELNPLIAEEIKKIKPGSLDDFSLDTLIKINPSVMPFNLDGMVMQADTAFQKIQAGIGTLKGEVIEMTSFMQSAIGGAFTSLGDVIGQALSGDVGGAAGFFKGILGIVVDFVGQFGKLLVGAGIAALNFKNLLVNPVAAIAAGVALIAISGAAKGLLSKGPGGGATGGGGSYSAPTNRASTSAFSGPGQNGGSAVEFKIKGTELVGVLRQQGYKDGR